MPMISLYHECNSDAIIDVSSSPIKYQLSATHFLNHISFAQTSTNETSYTSPCLTSPPPTSLAPCPRLWTSKEALASSSLVRKHAVSCYDIQSDLFCRARSHWRHCTKDRRTFR